VYKQASRSRMIQSRTKGICLG